MGYTYLGDSTLGVSLTISTPKPLDSRSVVSDISSLYSVLAESAYEGMQVVVLSEGKAYILKDKSKINSEDGWVTSSNDITVDVPIIACTQSEYEEWRENTSDDYTPIDESKKYLSENIYYYIFEESIENKDLYYLSAAQGKELEDKISKKADVESITKILERISIDETNLAENYTTTEALKTLLDELKISIDNNASEIVSIKDTHYTKEESDNTFLKQVDASDIYVTKEDLRGSETSEEDDFIFVTLNQYTADKEALAENIVTLNLETTNLNSTSITTENIKTDKINLTKEEESSEILFTEDRLTVDGELLAFVKEVPKIVYLKQSEYDVLPEYANDTYYFTYNDDETITYITSTQLKENTYTKVETDGLINIAKNELRTVDILLLSSKISDLEALIIALEARIAALEPKDEATPEEGEETIQTE